MTYELFCQSLKEHVANKKRIRQRPTFSYLKAILLIEKRKGKLITKAKSVKLLERLLHLKTRR